VPLTVEAMAGGGVISPLAGRLVALVARLVVDAVPLLAIPTNIDVLVSRIGLDQLLPGARLGPLQVLQVIRWPRIAIQFAERPERAVAAIQLRIVVSGAD